MICPFVGPEFSRDQRTEDKGGDGLFPEGTMGYQSGEGKPPGSRVGFVSRHAEGWWVTSGSEAEGDHVAFLSLPK